jgi:hypothetical protein
MGYPRDSQSANAAGTEQEIAIVLTGQSMIRSDIRVTAPAAVPVIQSLLNDDVMFTNLECTVAENGETAHEDRRFLTCRSPKFWQPMESVTWGKVGHPRSAKILAMIRLLRHCLGWLIADLCAENAVLSRQIFIPQ